MAKRLAKVNQEQCKGCRLCVGACPVKAITATNDLNSKGYKVVTIDEATCIGCGSCYKICPDYCFEVEYFATGEMTWEELKTSDETQWPDLDWADWTSYGSYMHTTNALDAWELGVGGGGMASEAYDPETGTITYLARFTVGNTRSFTDQPLTVLAAPPVLVVGGERTALADQPALITFQPSFEARSVSGEVRADGVIVSATVSPLAIQVAYRGPDYEDTGDLLWDTWVVYGDGTEAAVKDLTQGYGGSKSDSGTAHRSLDFSTTFLDLLDVDRVTAVRVGDLEIPLS